jgi:hypothetical protein
MNKCDRDPRGGWLESKAWSGLELNKAAPFLDANEEATRQVSQIEPTYIDPAIKAPKDQLEEEEKRDAAREAAKAVVIRLILVLRALPRPRRGLNRRNRNTSV